MDEFASTAKLACQSVSSAGAEFADVVCGLSRDCSVKVEKNGIQSASETVHEYVAVRALIKGAVGFSTSPSLEREEVVRAAKRAAELASFAQPDPAFRRLPLPEHHADVPDLGDPRVAALDAGALVRVAIQGIDSALSCHPGITLEGITSRHASETTLVNSLGLEERLESTSIFTYLLAVIREGDHVGSYYEVDYARTLKDFAPEKVGEEAARGALRTRSARNIRSGEMPAVLGPLAAVSLFQGVILCASAEEIQRKRSFLAGKRGEQIASPVLSLTDDAFIPGGMDSGAVDAEGSLRKKVEIVRDGVLTSYLHNLYTSLKGGEENTGHASDRFGHIGPTNLNPSLGVVPAAVLVSEIDDGIYIDHAHLAPNQVTGEISATVDVGFRIVKGRLTDPIKNAIVGANAIELLLGIDAISSDYRAEPGDIMPTVRLRRVKIAGGE